VKPVYNQNIPVQLRHIRPLGDLVLVKRIRDEFYDSRRLIWMPDLKRYQEDGKRIGEVLMCGPGDRLFVWMCWKCRPSGATTLSTFMAPPKCKACGNTSLELVAQQRHAMNCKPGDRILYDRSPANDVQIDGESYTFLHEQQHVLAVLSKPRKGRSDKGIKRGPYCKRDKTSLIAAA
jgi:co-chaperonin GroES (HSP10)